MASSLEARIHSQPIQMEMVYTVWKIEMAMAFKTRAKQTRYRKTATMMDSDQDEDRNLNGRLDPGETDPANQTLIRMV